ncbi:MAG: hypothetical protein KDA25_08650, partial [Phycisphaerales bacterium]|nr:hypothetical protein [Phycisphaerales bacterium]
GTDAETAPEFSTELTAVASTPRLADDPTLIAEAPSSFDIVPLHVGAAPAIPIAALPMPEAAAMPVDTQPLLPRMPEVAIDIDLPTDTLARSAASETADATGPRPMLEVATMAPVMVDTAPPDAAAVSMAAAPLSMPAPAPGHADVQAPPVPGMADARPSTAEVGLPSAPPTAVSIEAFPTVDAVASEEAAVTIAASRMDDTETPATMVPMPASSPTTVQAARVKVAAPASTSPVPRPSDLAYEAAVALRVDIPDRTRIEPPATVLPDEDPYRMRRAAERDALVEEMGGSRETEAAVAAALAWLAKQQQPDGHWDSFEHRSDCPDCEATADVDIALTGLSLLCFLAADHTHVKDGPYREVVQRGIDWLLGRQRRDGSFLGRESMYSHGIASIAMAEAYGMTGDVRLRAPTETATRFILDARHPEHGGWRYAPRQDGDTSVLGWQIMALRSARQAGVPIPDDVDTTTRRWLDTVSRPSRPGRYAYRPGEPPTPTMTAEAMFVRQLLGDPRDASGMDAATEHILGAMPNWERDSNSYYWYYATLALYQHQGDAWAQWNAAMKDTLLGHQVQRGPNAGSFPPAGQWARVGGRIYQTAICTLTLEVYYRYLPRYMVAAPDAADPTADE